MTPVLIDGCLGWLHPGRTRRGVVLCPPFGQELQFVHRDWRRLAEALADAGLTTVRLDYNGLGDSPGDEEDHGRLATWVGNIAAVARWLQAEQGVDEVILVGLKFGAALAAAAAVELGGVHGLALLAPTTSGRAHLRDLSVLSWIIHKERLRQGEEASVNGVTYSRETMTDLAGFHPFDGAGPPAQRGLALMPPGLELDRALTGWAQALGANFERDAFTGYAELMQNPDYNIYAEEAFGRVVAWAAAGAAPELAARRSPEPVVALELAHSREEMVAIDGTAPLFGILSRPRRAEARGPAVVFVNTGATSHQGAGRMWVLMARRFAELGLTSLRFDVAGVGDSPDRPGQTDPVMEVAGSIQDVSAALDWLEARGHAEVVLIGFCRGAQLSYLTAVSDPRVRAQILIGPPSYFWDEPPVHLYPRPTTQYVRMASDLQTWLGLLKGQIHPFSFVKGAVRLTKRTMEKRRFRAMVAETAARIRRKSKAVQTLLVVGDRDEQMTDMESYLQAPRATFPTLLGFRTIVLPDTDHLYLTKRHRQLLLAAVEPFLAELRDQPRLRTTANRSV